MGIVAIKQTKKKSLFITVRAENKKKKEMRKTDRGANRLQHNMSPGNFQTISLQSVVRSEERTHTHNVGRGYVQI